MPDMSREAQMWFYFMAVKYMEAGAEAFHCGQVHCNIDGLDGRQRRRLLQPASPRYVRLHRCHTRHRSWMLASNGGIVIDGRHCSISCRSRCPKEIVDEPVKAKLERVSRFGNRLYEGGERRAGRPTASPHP